MRIATLAVLASLLTACGGIRAPATVHPSWEPVFGTYEFIGSLTGRTPVSVSGTFVVGPEGYQVSSNRGSCHDRLERPWVGPEFGASCKGIRVSFRQLERGVAEDGTATISVEETRERQECRTDASGQQFCFPVLDVVTVTRDVRVKVRRLGAGEA